MKKLLAILMAVVLAAVGFAACSKTNTDTPDAGEPSAQAVKLSVVTTIFPEYDWVKQVAGDLAENMDITFLLNSGVDLHNYQPTADDIIKISDCDLFIYVGGESDEWVKDALANVTNKDMKVINLLEALGDSVKEEEVVEGMEAEHDHEEGEEHEEGPEYDEHIWLSLKNTQVLVSKIAAELSALDAANQQTYTDNAAAYNAQLAELDAQYQAAVDAATQKTVLFGDRFPFRYMTDDYGLDYFAAFVGCSAETEASFETVSFLANKVDELGLKAVLTIEGTDHRIAETIVANTSSKDQQILTLDSMQGTTAADVEAGASYLAIMQSNLEVLKEALK